MAEQEEQPLTASDSPVSGPSRTRGAVALAQLLHHECTNLLQLYKDRETFLSDHTQDGERLVTVSAEAEGSSTKDQVQLLHSALRKCLGLLHCLIQKEEQQWGKLQGDYETLKKTVRDRLEQLLHTTKELVGTKDTTLEVTPDHPCDEELDGAEGVFGLKMWTHRVLLELIHWADHAAKTLHVFHVESEKEEEI